MTSKEKIPKNNPVTARSSQASFCPLFTLFYHSVSTLNHNMLTVEICFVLIVLQTQCQI